MYGMISGIYSWLRFEHLTGRRFDSAHSVLRRTLKEFEKQVPSRYLAPFLDMALYLPDDICCKVDRASMAHSLEVRPPLLDHRIVEFAISLPFSYQYDRRHGGKRILKKVLERYIPRTLWDRPKQGFSTPLGDWFRTALKDSSRQLLTPETIHREWNFNPEFIRKLLEDHWLERRNNQYFLWLLYVLAVWQQKKNPNNP